MSHANAVLTPRTRERLALLVIKDGWTYAAAAKMFMVTPRTAKKWADRYRAERSAGMGDRSSRPHTSPTKTGPEVVKRIVALRWRQRLGPVQIGGRLGLPASTVHAVPSDAGSTGCATSTGSPANRCAATSTTIRGR